MFLPLCMIALLGGMPISPAWPQTAATKLQDQSELAFNFPDGYERLAPAVQTMSDGSRIVRHMARAGDGSTAEVTFIARKQDLSKADVWPLLERLITNTLEKSTARLVRAEPSWAEGLPSYRYHASLPTRNGRSALVIGRFILAPEGIVFAQAVVPESTPPVAKRCRDFLSSVRGPGLSRPGHFALKFGTCTLRYPAGFLPRVRDGILDLVREDGTAGVVFRLQRDAADSPEQVTCTLASSLNRLTANGAATVSLRQGPGPLKSSADGTRAWGYACGVHSTTGNAARETREVCVRFYRKKTTQLFVSAFVRPGAGGIPSESTIKQVRIILDSVNLAP